MVIFQGSPSSLLNDEVNLKGPVSMKVAQDLYKGVIACEVHLPSTEALLCVIRYEAIHKYYFSYLTQLKPILEILCEV